MMEQYETFFQLHHREKPFILANAWNVKSAQIIEQNRYEAIGTSSGAISNSMGYADGEKMPFEEVLYIIKRIKAATSIPLSVDFEKGYTDDLDKLTDNIARLLDTGVAGINVEDAQGEDIYLRKLETIKNYTERNNQKLFINARTDGFLQKLDQPLELTIKRAKLYKDAGADGLFVTAVNDPAIISTIASSIALPLNVVGSPKLASFETLGQCGVKRISTAVLLYKAGYNKLETLVKEVNAQQSMEPLF